jgi:N-acetylmuramoyl-L-alanine amidase
MPTRAQVIPILTGLALSAWLLHPVSTPPPFELEENDLTLHGRDLHTDQATFERWLGWVDPYGQLRDSVVTTQENLTVSLDGHQPFSASWPSRASTSNNDPIEGSAEGLTVLLDPGHYGGAWSEHESRHFQRDGEHPIREGDLTYATALLAAEALTNAGATVYLSRSPPPTTPFETHIPSRALLEREAAIWLGNNAHRADTRLLMQAYPMWIADRLLRYKRDAKVRDSAAHLFTLGDLRQRSSLATACNAHALISIHYNGAKRPEVNHVMAFVPGHFMKGELISPAARRLALDALISGRLPVSTTLAKRIVDALQTEMNLGTIDEAKRGRSFPIPGHKGVFARNLAVLRRTRVPVVLAEGPFMSHPGEYNTLLNARDGSPGIRPKQYARAISRALAESASLLKAHRDLQPEELNTGACPLQPWSPE